MTVHRNAWGRVLDGPGSSAVEVSAETLVGMFREVGLEEAAAERAAAGVRSGTYLSFEDAAQSQVTFGRSVRVLSPAKVAEVAARLEGAPAPATGHKGLVERRTPMQVRPQILERASASIAGDARLKVCLISEGQGSSGYYPSTTLREAAAAGVFAAGTHCYVDHPTKSEAVDRPERSVMDLAGVLETAATYRDGALYADVRVYASHRELITDRASVIGMSIRGDGVIERKDMSGFTRSVVTSLTRVDSVDFVTRPGRGGRIVDF